MFLSLEEAYGRICSRKHALTFHMVTDVVSRAAVLLRIFNWRPQINLESLNNFQLNSMDLLFYF